MRSTLPSSPSSPNSPSSPGQLRVNAEDHLKTRAVPVTQGWTTGAPALALLHGLASEPASASEALKLLHELQVHQVELDLQYEQAEQERRQLSETLDSYIDLFDSAPFAYLAVDAKGRLTHVNQAGMTWLGITDRTWMHRTIQEFLSPPSQQLVGDALLRLRAGSTNETFEVQPHLASTAQQVVVTAAPDGLRFLMACSTPVSANRL